MTPEHKGSCFCGTVQFSVVGEPLVMGYCHCSSCRHWSASPVNGFSLWKAASFSVTQGEDHIGTYNKTPISGRKWCTQCGGHIYNDHPTMDLVDVFASVLPTLEFKPSMHVNYAETTMRVRDGLPKLKDFPTDMGGSGELLPE